MMTKAVFQNIQIKKVKDKYSSMEQQFNEFKNQQESNNIKNNESLAVKNCCSAY